MSTSGFGRQRVRTSTRATAREAERQRQMRHQMLDLLSAIVQAHGGRIELTFEQVDGVRRFPINVQVDKEHQKVIVTTEGYVHPPTLKQKLGSKLLTR